MPLEENRIPEIIARLEANLENVVDRAGFLFEREAKERARVRTGYMRNAIRWIPDEGDKLKGEVVGGADYTVYNEYGTAFMSAQPMFWPAAEVVQPIFAHEVTLAVRSSVEG
jgi:HK97 gp10 family phage protein